MIISVHLPKTAGTSFAAALELRFGNKLFKDYDGYCVKNVTPLSPIQDKYRANLKASLKIAKKSFTGIECIHGHFFPIKYLLLSTLRDLKFVTWLRHPVDRILSQYHYWRKVYDKDTSDAFHKKIIEENWSLERFCLGPELRNHYREKLWGFPLEYFDFIGITEHYEMEIKYFAEHFLHTKLEPQWLNTGDNMGKAYDISESFRNEIETYHAEDMSLYKRALQIREQRNSQ